MTLQKARIKYHDRGTEHITNPAINGMESFEALAARILPYTLIICTEPSMGCRLCRPRLSSLFVQVQSALWLRIEPQSPPLPHSQLELGKTTLIGHGYPPCPPWQCCQNKALDGFPSLV